MKNPSDKNEYNIYDPIKIKINTYQLFLVSLIIQPTEIKPLFVVDNVTFGLDRFNTWKIENGFPECLSKIEPIPFIQES